MNKLARRRTSLHFIHTHQIPLFTMIRAIYAALLGLCVSVQSGNAQFYDMSVLQDINIHFYNPNWDAILDSLVAINSNTRLLANITINGTQFDSVGIRYKGNSSHSPQNVKNPFNIKLNHIISGQKYQGYKTIKLSNVFKDPTFVREALGYEIARNYLPSPQANYARVYIDGTYHGLYTNVESVNDDFTNKHYGSEDLPMFKCDPISMSPPPIGCNPGGSALEYLGNDTACFYQRYELESDYGWVQLRNLTNTLNNTPAQTAQILDIDRALWMLAFDNLLVNLDSYLGSGHNYYIYQDHNGRFHTALWDCNEAFGAFANGGQGNLTLAQRQQLSPLHNLNFAGRPLVQKLLANPLHRKSYIAHLRTMFNECIANGWYLNRAQALQTLISQAVQSDPNKFFSNADFSNNLNNTVGMIPGITELMNARIAFLQSDTSMTKVPPAISNVQSAVALPVVGSNFFITAQVSGATLVKLRTRPGKFDVFQSVDMFDDGLHGDGAAGDGVYGAQATMPYGGMQYYIFAENADAAMFAPERAEYEFYTILSSSTNNLNPGDLVINEFMASNQTAFADQNGEFDDWIEIHNPGSSPVSMLDVFLTDNLNMPNKWAFPDTFIAAGGYLIIWADENGTQPGLHANFKLSATGERVGLFNLNGTPIDTLTYGPQGNNISYGRYPNGSGPFGVMPHTPGAFNVPFLSVETLPQGSLQTWKLYPNPSATGRVWLEVQCSDQSPARLSVSDYLGRTLYEMETILYVGSNRLEVDLTAHSPGLYLVHLHTEQGERLTAKWLWGQ